MTLIPQNTEAAIISIETSWNKTVQSLLETANLLIEYQKREDWFQIKAELAARKIMKSEVLSMMTSIGRNRLLNDGTYTKTLPCSYNSLYHLSKMDEHALKEKLDSGAITPTIRLIDVREFTETQQKKKSTTSKSFTKRLTVNAEDYQKHKKAIDKVIANLRQSHPYISIK